MRAPWPLLLLLSATAAAAPSEPSTNDAEAGFVVPLRWENDATFSGFYTYADSDRYYSAAIRLGRFMTSLRPVAAAARPLRVVGRALGADRIAWGGTPLALDMYTPNDITRADPILDDRPYAGWLRTTAEVRLAWDGAHPWRGRLALSLGVVGPASLGEQAQRAAHEILRDDEQDAADPHTIPDPDPAGWSNQIGRDGSLVVPQLTANVEQRVAEYRNGRLHVGLGWTGSVEAGRVEVSAGAGPILRVRLGGASFGDRARTWEVAAFVRVLGRGVAWNLLLAGGGGSHGVDGEPFVFETEWGVSVRYRRVFVHWAVTSWSREQVSPPEPSGYWESLAGDRGRWFDHHFGRLEIGWLL
jgi:lipid A 3-O-deacylase